LPGDVFGPHLVLAQSEPVAMKSFAPIGSRDGAMERPSREERAVELNEQGVELVFRGSKPEGIAKIKQALAHDPANTTILYNLAGLYLAENRPQEAVAIMETALQREPGEATFLRRLAESALLANQMNIAVSAFEKLSQVEPQNGEALLKLGTLYAMQKRWEEAEDTLRNARKLLDVSDMRVLKNLANVLVVQAKYSEAVSLLQDIQAAENSAENEIALAIAYEGLGELPLAISHYREAQVLGEHGEDLAGHIARLEKLNLEGSALASDVRGASGSTSISESSSAPAAEPTGPTK
jgi:Flp pilus assembly protein TadD